MQSMLATLLKRIEADPAQALTVLGPVLDIFGPALVPIIAGFIPAGPLRVYAEANPTETLAFVRDALATGSKHPDLVKAALAQFAK